MDTVSTNDKLTAREAILAWAASPGFAAIHNGQAINEQITDHLLEWLATAGFVIIPWDDDMVIADATGWR